MVSSRNPLASRILFLLLQAVEELETAIVAPWPLLVLIPWLVYELECCRLVLYCVVPADLQIF